MTYTQDSPIPTMTSSEHHISLRNRKRMDVTAVKAMERFDTEEFFVRTGQGFLTIKGTDLRIVHLDVDKGMLSLEGLVESVHYNEDGGKDATKGILQKLFG